MTQTVDFDIVGSFNNERVTSIDAERTVNMFEYLDPLGKKPKSLVYTSGLVNTDSVFTGASATHGFRASFVFNNIEYDLIGDNFYRILPNGTVTHLGSVSNSSGYANICGNTYQLFIVDGQAGFIYDTLTGVFKQITDPAFPALPIDCTYLDGFFVVAAGNTNTFYLSSLNQGLVWGVPVPGSSSPNTFTMAALSTNIVLTSGTTANYQVGTTVQFSGGSLPAELNSTSVYYVVNVVSGSTIEVSATDGGTPISSVAGGSGNITNNGTLQVGSITSDTGTIVGCRTLHRRLFLFSQFFTEVWENAGLGTTLPFRRNNSLLIQFGTPAVGSIESGFDTMIFISQSRKGLGSVVQVAGVTPVPISTTALDNKLSEYAAQGQISDCYGFLVQESNIIFYRMNFTAANHTYVYNLSMSNMQGSDAEKLWHEEEVLNGDRHPAQTSSFLNGINYVGSYNSPTRYMVDKNVYTNDGEHIRRMRITRAIVPPGYQRIRIDRLQLDLLQGQLAQLNPVYDDGELQTEDGNNIDTELDVNILVEQGFAFEVPLDLFVFLSISKDGGQSYGYSMRAPMGNVGQRTARTLWRKLGVIPRGQAFVAKFEFFAPYPFVILGASWAIEVLPE